MRGYLIRKGARSYMRWRWPWFISKPFEHPTIRLDSLGGGVGDELMCTPIFREIHRRNPACRITFLSRYPEMFCANPNLAAVEPYSTDAARKAYQLSYLPVLPPPKPLIRLMGECIGIELDSHQLDPPDISPTVAVRERMAAVPRPCVIVQPRASQWTPNKEWPKESWVALIQKLLERFDVIELGTQPYFPEHDFGKRFHSFAGTTTLPDFIWLVAQGDVFVGPVSGGMHIANAFRVPAVIIFGGYESPAGHFYPLNEALYSPVPCAPCWLTTPCPYDLKCLRMIAPEKVFRKICEVVSAPDVPEQFA